MNEVRKKPIHVITHFDERRAKEDETGTTAKRKTKIYLNAATNTSFEYFFVYMSVTTAFYQVQWFGVNGNRINIS